MGEGEYAATSQRTGTRPALETLVAQPQVYHFTHYRFPVFVLPAGAIVSPCS